jgi:hypothetical protein
MEATFTVRLTLNHKAAKLLLQAVDAYHDQGCGDDEWDSDDLSQLKRGLEYEINAQTVQSTPAGTS